MHAYAWFPWLFSLGNVASILLTTRGKVLGFVVLIPTQLGAVIYYLLTGQPGFLLGNFAMTAAASMGIWRWHRHGVHRDARRTRPAEDED
jgi:hypothetical protein